MAIKTDDLELRFRPWVGPTFGACCVVPCRVLVLGESHYSENAEEPADFTHRLTAGYLAGTVRHRFWTTVARLALGRAATFAERASFWREVAFYNYVQEIVGPGSRVRPSPAAWEGARAPFERVLARLQPEAVLVLGKALWSNVPSGEARELVVAGQPWPAWRYECGGGRSCVATYVKHPASPGFSWRKWRTIAAALFEAGASSQMAYAQTGNGRDGCNRLGVNGSNNDERTER